MCIRDRDKGVVLLIDNRFAMPDYRRLMPPHWSHLKMIYDTEKLEPVSYTHLLRSR